MALFDLLAHYSIFLPEFVKFRLTPGFAEFYKNLSHFDNRVIIYPEKASMATLSTFYTNWAHVLGLKIHLRRPFCFCVEASYFCMLCYAVKSCQIWLKL